jgi:hypothetical protein
MAEEQKQHEAGKKERLALEIQLLTLVRVM